MNKEIRYSLLSLALTYSIYNRLFYATPLLITAKARSVFDEFNVKGVSRGGRVCYTLSDRKSDSRIIVKLLFDESFVMFRYFQCDKLHLWSHFPSDFQSKDT